MQMFQKSLIFLTLATVSLVTFSPASAQVTTIDFDTIPTDGSVPAVDTPITNQYPGVVFSGDGTMDCSIDDFEVSSRPNSLKGGGTNNSQNSPYLAPINMAFNTPVQSVSLTVGGVGVNGIGLYAFDATNAVVGMQEIMSTGAGRGERSVLSVTASGRVIVRATVRQLQDVGADGYTIDDLTFGDDRMAVCGNGVREGTEVCDDGNTTDCDGCSSDCTRTIQCTASNGDCVVLDDEDPTNACQVCVVDATSTSGGSFGNVRDGTSCDDGSMCTTNDSCSAGTCGGQAVDCDDSLSCTADSCDPENGSCVNTLTTGCLIGGACVADGAEDPDNVCQFCDAGSSSSNYSARADGTVCGDPSCDSGQLTRAATCQSATCTAGETSACPGGSGCADAMTCDSCENDTDCSENQFCGPQGGCVSDLEAGGACDRAAQCGSGFCTDSVCCESACSGTCEACGSNGTCDAIEAGTDPANECEGDLSCDGARMCEQPSGQDAGPTDAGVDGGTDAGADSGPVDAGDSDAGGGVSGGSCSASSGVSGSSMLVMFLLGLVVIRRRD